VQGEVNPVDEENAMRVGIKEKSLALRQKLEKLTTVANPKLGGKFLAQVTIILSILLKINLYETLLIACIIHSLSLRQVDRPYEGPLVGLVELFYKHMNSSKVFECTSWRGEALSMARKAYWYAGVS
jgi:hypothetical protein